LDSLLSDSRESKEHTMSIVSFNGKTYNSLEEMPADQRAAYERVMAFLKDENHNGIPDMFEGDAIQKMVKLAANSRVVINGQEMKSLDSLPPEARAKFDQAMQRLSQLGISLPTGQQMPGILSQPAGQSATPQIAPAEPAFPQSPSIIQSSPSAISEETGSRTGVLLLAVLGVVLLCALAAAAGYLFLNY
jgi:hypothetical protein